MKRRARYLLSSVLFLDVLNGHRGLALPADVEVIGVKVDHYRAMVELLCRSETFDELGEGFDPPIQDLEVTAWR